MEHKEYEVPKTCQSLIEYFDTFMEQPEDRRRGFHLDYVLCTEGNIALFWDSEAAGGKDEKTFWSRDNLVGISIIELNEFFQRKGVFTRLL